MAAPSLTVDEIAFCFDALRGDPDILDRLYATRAAPRHPLNSAFLDRVLRDRAVADRDLRWTEWLRSHRRRLRKDAVALAADWRDGPNRSGADRLRAQWLMWTLTSTDRDLRDAATAALYWYGRHAPSELFSLAVDSLSIDDPYVSERTLAAAYGVCTAHQVTDDVFEGALAAYLTALGIALSGPDATHPTSHALSRYYVSSTFDFAREFIPEIQPTGTPRTLQFAAGPVAEPILDGDPEHGDVRQALRMDFHNYTLGRLFRDRRNYDFAHAGHQAATNHLLGMVSALGWRSERFGAIDEQIDRHLPFDEPNNVDRYGKKYGWIGLYNVAGSLADQGSPPTWLEVDIDPTFPQPPERAPLELATWARRTPAADRSWLRQGIVKVPDDFLCPASLDSDAGPWLLAHAEIETEDPMTGRNTFGLMSTVLVPPDDLAHLVEEFDGSAYPRRELFERPSDYYVFAGEVPWHDRFARPEPSMTVGDLYRRDLSRAGREIRTEWLVHDCRWESDRGDESRADAFVPSRLFSEAFGLRSVPASLDQIDPTGTRAARSFAAPAGYTGRLLYLRADLVRSYAGGRSIVTFASGERRLQLAWPEEQPRAAQNAYRSYANVWRFISTH